jgi:hypothetical protein
MIVDGDQVVSKLVFDAIATREREREVGIDLFLALF